MSNWWWLWWSNIAIYQYSPVWIFSFLCWWFNQTSVIITRPALHQLSVILNRQQKMNWTFTSGTLGALSDSSRFTSLHLNRKSACVDGQLSTERPSKKSKNASVGDRWREELEELCDVSSGRDEEMWLGWLLGSLWGRVCGREWLLKERVMYCSPLHLRHAQAIPPKDTLAEITDTRGQSAPSACVCVRVCVRTCKRLIILPSMSWKYYDCSIFPPLFPQVM